MHTYKRYSPISAMYGQTVCELSDYLSLMLHTYNEDSLILYLHVLYGHAYKAYPYILLYANKGDILVLPLYVMNVCVN